MSQQQLSFLDRFSFHLAHFLLGNVVVENIKEATSETSSQPVQLYWRSQFQQEQSSTSSAIGSTSGNNHTRLVFADITWRFQGTSIQVLFGFFLFNADEASGIYYQCAPLTQKILSDFAQSLGVDETSGPPVAIAELIAQALQVTSTSNASGTDGSGIGQGDSDGATGGNTSASHVPSHPAQIPTIGQPEDENKTTFLHWGLFSPQVQEVGTWKLSVSQSTRQLDTLGLDLLLRVPSQSKAESKSPSSLVMGVSSLEATLERWWQHEQQLANIPEESLPVKASSLSSAALPPPTKRRPNSSVTGPRSVPVGGSKKRKTKLTYLDSSNA